MMLRVTEVFELNMVTDDPRFEGFALDPYPSVLGNDSLDDDLTPGFADADTNPNWSQHSLAANWPIPAAKGRVSEFNDYPCVDMVLPAFSNRAVSALHEFLEPNGELLPIATQTQTQYFLYNIRMISDALDQAASKCEFWCDPPTTATDIDTFVFDSGRLQGHSIFWIREYPMSVLVTNVFVDVVVSSNLQGFSFSKLWPLPAGVSWRGKKSAQFDQRQTLKCHSLVLILPVCANNADLAKIAQFEDDLDSRLRLETLSAEYFGCYEGYENLEYRDSREKGGKAPNTLNRRISSVSNFYKYLQAVSAAMRLPIAVPTESASHDLLL